MRTKACDPIDLTCTNPTIYTYDTSGLFLNEIQYPHTGSTAHTEFFNYDLNTGLLNWHKDQSGQQTTFAYDSLRRPTSVSYPDTGSATYTYNDTVSYPNSPSFTYTRKITSTTNLVQTGIVDGLGRQIRSFTTNGESLPYDQLDTCYDADGRVGFTPYPYQGNGASTPRVCSGAGDAFTYDGLGRVTQVTHSDGSTILTSYTGPATSVQDEGNGTQRIQRISQADALGRLASVCEVSGSLTVGIAGSQTASACNLDIPGTGFLTTYGYDTLDNLTSVAQGPLNPRSFVYDSLSRLTQATNPESGSICYGTVSAGVCQNNGYDANGNVTKKTDARGIVVNYAYDALNRLTGKTYSDSTPAAAYNYDQTSAMGLTLTNTIGRRSSIITAGSSPSGSVFSYDSMGRVLNNSQCTPQNCSGTPFSLAYTYDLIGDVLTSTNGLGLTLTSSVNVGGRLTSLANNATAFGPAGTLFSAAHYNAAGSLLSASLGNGINEARCYDGRLRLGTISAGSVYSLAIPVGADVCGQTQGGGYAPNGNILQAVDSANGTWSYVYDQFNRLCAANQSATQPTCAPFSGLYTYSYDRFGNRWQQNGPHSSLPGFDANNHMVLTGVGYDLAGNTTGDGTLAYTSDAEERVTTAGGSSTYVYDADGRRIRKTTSAGGTVDFLYDTAGHEIAQISSTGTWTRGEIYAGGRHLATLSSNTTYFNHADWLGTERARSNSAGASCETITSLPFGDGQTTSGNCGDPSPMHFTGKERDSESGLDNFGARYDSSQYDRFMSPDPMGGHLEDPQTLNRYSYVRNNPLSLTDPTGLDFYLQCHDQENHKNCTQVQIDPHKNDKTWLQADKDGSATIITRSHFKTLRKVIMKQAMARYFPFRALVRAATTVIGGRIGPSQTGPGHVKFFAEVDDLEATLQRVERLGGQEDCRPISWPSGSAKLSLTSQPASALLQPFIF